MLIDPFDVLTGNTQEHLTPCWSGALVHRDVLAPLTRLRQKAKAAGFELAIASSYRGFERQQLIWQDKVSGKRPIYTHDGSTELDPASLTPQALLWAILRWSALPGTSRHHWGTDFDVYDCAAVAKDYRLQLVPEEYEPPGPFAGFTQWFREALERDESEGFFLPYAQDMGAVAPEPWHISYAPIAQVFQREFDVSVFNRLLERNCWPLGEEIRANAEIIYQRYVNLDSASASE